MTEAEARAVLARTEKTMRALLRQGERTAWTIGRIFDELARARLHRSAGFDSLARYADTRFVEGFRTLKRYRRVATAFAEATVERHGVTKLDLGLTYANVTGRHGGPADVLGLVIHVPAKGTEEARKVPFVRVTAGELARAVLHAKKIPEHADGFAGLCAKRRRVELQALVAAPPGSHVPAPTVRSRTTHLGLVRFDLVGIDMDDLERVGRALIAMARKQRPKGRGARAA
jgi:hypothetical protein